MKTEISIDIIDRNRRIDFRDGFTFSLSDDKDTVQIRVTGEQSVKTIYVDIVDLQTAIKKLER